MVIYYIIMLWFAALIAALPLGHLMGVDEERGQYYFALQFAFVLYK